MPRQRPDHFTDMSELYGSLTAPQLSVLARSFPVPRGRTAIAG